LFFFVIDYDSLKINLRTNAGKMSFRQENGEKQMTNWRIELKISDNMADFDILRALKSKIRRSQT